MTSSLIKKKMRVTAGGLVFSQHVYRSPALYTLNLIDVTLGTCKVVPRISSIDYLRSDHGCDRSTSSWCRGQFGKFLQRNIWLFAFLHRFM